MIFAVHRTIKYFRLGLIFVAVQVFIFAKCNKDPSPCRGGGGYAFLATSKWSPEKPIYNVGDTLYLTSRIPKSLTDQINTSMIVDYSNTIGINGNIAVVFPDNQTKQNIPAIDSFQVIPIEGEVKRHSNLPQSLLTSIYSASGGEFVFQLMIICQKKGYYVLSVDNLSSKGIQGKNCSNASFNMNVTNFNRNEIRYQNTLGVILDAESIKKIYCIEVQ